ncbi:MAG: N-acetylmuramic acid 6-phosphate etherase [Candidatus Hydrogenedentes bacterium]|nr:N-acetylmuramic acid 6-phosphate etherase [Candidatus Hydrogenedentota bacterium]
MNILALEGGGTRTVGGLYNERKVLLGEAVGAPCNPVAYGVARSVEALVEVANSLLRQGKAGEAAIAVAGALDPAHRQAMGEGVARAFGLQQVLLATDLHALLWGNAGNRPALLVIAGTGSSVLARDGSGILRRAGGRGTVLGDQGSAYHIAVAALRAAAKAVDGAGPETLLVDSLPPAAGKAQFEELVGWSATASKREIAALAEHVSAAASAGDAVAAGIVEEQAHSLAALVPALIGRHSLPESSRILLHGGLFFHCPRYRRAFEASVMESSGRTCEETSVRGHAAALKLLECLDLDDALPEWLTRARGRSDSIAVPPTEGWRVGAAAIDHSDAAGVVEAMTNTEEEVSAALRSCAASITLAVEAAAASLRAGGRILYVGAGTSGRLGVLDASECPPTFGVEPDRVVGIMAGGDAALRDSTEGSEDDEAAGQRDLLAHRPESSDFVVGIAASGATPYTLAALRTARQAGAKTCLLCCNPQAASTVDVLIALDTGPEVLAGSTRLKAGTATKAVLNMISTGAMALSGLVYDGLMVGMQPTNHKLRARAARIVAAITELLEAEAVPLLERAGWDIRTAVVMAWANADPSRAREILDSSKGDLRRVKAFLAAD